jgi:hypothetical protein
MAFIEFIQQPSSQLNLIVAGLLENAQLLRHLLHSFDAYFMRRFHVQIVMPEKKQP